MFSVYTQAYNISKYNIDVKGALINFLKFLESDDEIVIAYNSIYERIDCDPDYKVLNEQIKDAKSEIGGDCANVKVVQSKFVYDDPEFDGKVKNAALQATTEKVKIQMDIDERFDIKQKDMWRKILGPDLADPKRGGVFCYLIPTIDLWGDASKIRKNVNIGTKFRIHNGPCRRGVPNWAYNEDGTINTEKSDTTEPIDKKGFLVDSNYLIPPSLLTPETVDRLPFYTIHLGYLNFEYREKIDEFWNPHWALRNGNKKQDPKQTIEKLAGEEVIDHNLKFEL